MGGDFTKISYDVFHFHDLMTDKFHDNAEFTDFMDTHYREGLTLLVGHNISFDLLYLKRLYAIGRPTIFDTSVAHYLITGQSEKWPALARVIDHYGIPSPKDERLKEIWECKIDTTEINPDLLLPYLRNDVETTERIFRYQINDLQKLGMINIFMASMAAQVHTTEMSWNGMRIDKDKLRYHAAQYKDWLERESGDFMDDLDISISSAQQCSAYIFGGSVKEDYVEEVTDDLGNAVHYKSGEKKGERKTRKSKRDRAFTQRIHPDVVRSIRGKSGYYSLDDGVLKNLCTNKVEVAERILAYRTRYKTYNSFLKAYMDILHGLDSDFIHPNINSTATATGRLSQSKPNLQQVP
jgi:DNA polymerase I-like protein with 3'-5' exonuclease and polymerase domains